MVWIIVGGLMTGFTFVAFVLRMTGVDIFEMTGVVVVVEGSLAIGELSTCGLG